MLANRTALVFVLAVASYASSAFALPRTNCPLREHHVLSVTPYYTPKRVKKGPAMLRLRGAELFVEAQPGLTAEWLQLTLERHIAEPHNSAAETDCALAEKNVSVQVGSGGNGFHVWIVGRDLPEAKEILRRAKLLLK